MLTNSTGGYMEGGGCQWEPIWEVEGGYMA